MHAPEPVMHAQRVYRSRNICSYEEECLQATSVPLLLVPEDAATVVEDLQTAYRVGKGFLRQEEIDAAEAAAEDDESEMVVEADEPLQGDEPEESAVAFQSNFPAQSSPIANRSAPYLTTSSRFCSQQVSAIT